MGQIEFGNRIPFDVKESFRKVLEDSIMVPSLSHYLKCVHSSSPCIMNSINIVSASWMPGELAITQHPLTPFIDISITLCKIETACSINMLL